MAKCVENLEAFQHGRFVSMFFVFLNVVHLHEALTGSPAGPRGPSFPVFPGGPRGPGGPGGPGGPVGPAWPWSPCLK